MKNVWAKSPDRAMSGKTKAKPAKVAGPPPAANMAVAVWHGICTVDIFFFFLYFALDILYIMLQWGKPPTATKGETMLDCYEDETALLVMIRESTGTRLTIPAPNHIGFCSGDRPTTEQIVETQKWIKEHHPEFFICEILTKQA